MFSHSGGCPDSQAFGGFSLSISNLDPYLPLNSKLNEPFPALNIFAVKLRTCCIWQDNTTLER